MNYENLTAILNTVNSILELSDGPVEGVIKMGKHDLQGHRYLDLKRTWKGN